MDTSGRIATLVNKQKAEILPLPRHIPQIEQPYTTIVSGKSAVMNLNCHFEEIKRVLVAHTSPSPL